MIRKAHRPTLVIAGAGMAAARLVEEILRRDPDRFQVRMFAAEPHGTYNRSRLSSVLAGDAGPERLWLNPLHWYEDHGLFVHNGVKADIIDLKNRLVQGGGGKVVEPFDYLVLATGSRPYVPPLEGSRQTGVFVFRTLDDCAAIASYAQNCRRAVVLGGGLLGLETAQALLAHGLEVTVVEKAPRLMAQQLGPPAAALLQRKLSARGLRFVLSAQATTVQGDGKVRGIQLDDGATLETDMLVISCGTCPNVEEARAAGLAVERGIVVDDQLRTSGLDVFAVGECAQHRGQVYDRVDPVYEQAAVLADVLTAVRSAAYQGWRAAAPLQVMGVDLTAAAAKNKVEIMKKAKDGLDVLEDIRPLAAGDRWAEMSEDDKQRAKGSRNI